MRAERRREPPARSPDEVLQRLPAGELPDRLDTPTIAIGTDGVVVYANSACEKMLGYQTAATLKGQSLAALLIGASHLSAPREWFELLRDRDTVTNWNHSDGYPVAAIVSDSMLLRGTDVMLMVTLTDVTHWVWSGMNGAIPPSRQSR